MNVVKWFEERERALAEQLAAAEEKAHADGKEPFDLPRLEELLNRGSQQANAKQHRVNYYVYYPEIRTLAEYVKMLLVSWDEQR